MERIPAEENATEGLVAAAPGVAGGLVAVEGGWMRMD